MSARVILSVPIAFLCPGPAVPQLVTFDDIMEFDLECNPIDQRGRVMYGERPIHGAIFQVRPDVGSVVHNHAHEVIPYSVTKVPMRQIIHTAGGMGHHVPVWDIHDDFGDTDMLVRNMQQGRSLAKALGNNAAVLMRGHGCTVTGRTVRDAVRIAVYLMVNARLQTEAMRLGDVTFLSAGEMTATAEMSASPLSSDRIWENWTRRSGYEIPMRLRDRSRNEQLRSSLIGFPRDNRRQCQQLCQTFRRRGGTMTPEFDRTPSKKSPKESSIRER